MKKRSILLGLMIFMTSIVSFVQNPASVFNSPLDLSRQDKTRLANTSENIEKLMNQLGFVYKSNTILVENACNNCSSTCYGTCAGSCSGTCSGSCTGDCSGTAKQN